MAKFKIYKNGDIGAPTLTAATGSLLNIFNQCLVTGYLNHPPAGWLKPLPDTSSYGMFTQPSGSGLSLFIYDQMTGTYGTRDARASGWEAITAIDNGFATGSNAFPTIALESVASVGGVVIKKSVALDTITFKNWILFADDRTFYFFNQTEASTFEYSGFSFGDIYSFVATGSDVFKCIIVGRSAENQTALSYDGMDATNGITSYAGGNFMARTYNGSGTCIRVGKHADSNRSSDPSTYPQIWGSNQYPNGTDMGLYMTPLYINENITGVIRGTFRGLYGISHGQANFSDGQTFSGSGDFAGKTFMILKLNANGRGVHCIETSDTLDTNA
jgi:hypothetical protein